MMDANLNQEPIQLQDLIDRIIRDYGTGRVVRALITNMSGRLRQPPRAERLNNHMRRDVGLPPHDPPSPFRGPMM